MGGQPRLDGHRISVLQVSEWVHEDGMDPENVATEFDLELADVYRALTYYYDNIEEMTEWRERRTARIKESREQGPSPDSFSETV
ncbi:DUF433 domain-containing protein [Natronorarus salvus]|uniref:DUF433 domain-containing protein n=1 Tax=Natronorarus salvus TaxID=3117733 RepID=UPI002F26A790